MDTRSWPRFQLVLDQADRSRCAKLPLMATDQQDSADEERDLLLRQLLAMNDHLSLLAQKRGAYLQIVIEIEGTIDSLVRRHFGIPENQADEFQSLVLMRLDFQSRIEVLHAVIRNSPLRDVEGSSTLKADLEKVRNFRNMCAHAAWTTLTSSSGNDVLHLTTYSRTGSIRKERVDSKSMDQQIDKARSVYHRLLDLQVSQARLTTE
jgi:hypothetical protein